MITEIINVILILVPWFGKNDLYIYEMYYSYKSSRCTFFNNYYINSFDDDVLR